MSRPIDVDALWMDVIRSMDYCDDILEIIERQPTIEERKKGEWIPHNTHFTFPTGETSNGGVICSSCGFETHNKLHTIFGCPYKYCPNCGAEMVNGGEYVRCVEKQKEGYPQDYSVETKLKTLPPAQLKLVRCEGCEHDRNCKYKFSAQVGGLSFCLAEERREE